MGSFNRLGEALVRMRRNAHLSQRQLAIRMGQSDHSTVKNFERRGSGNTETLDAYLTALGCDLYDLANAIDEVTGRVTRDDARRQESEKRDALADAIARLSRELDEAERRSATLEGQLAECRKRNG